MTNPFGTHSSAGNWLSPKNLDGHLLIIANVSKIVTKYDDLAGGDRDFATFDYADVDGGGGWQIGVTDNHIGIVNKLKDSVGAGKPPLIGRIGQAETKKGMKAWVYADVINEPSEAANVAKAAAWLSANPVPATASPFAQPAAPAAPAPAPVAAAPAAQSGDVADLLRQLEAAQAATRG